MAKNSTCFTFKTAEEIKQEGKKLFDGIRKEHWVWDFAKYIREDQCLKSVLDGIVACEGEEREIANRLLLQRWQIIQAVLFYLGKAIRDEQDSKESGINWESENQYFLPKS